jgi:hypothetical protein
MQQNDRKWTTVIQAVDSTDWAVPPYIVVRAGTIYLHNTTTTSSRKIGESEQVPINE